MSGLPVEHQGRRVKIFQPASGTGGVKNMPVRWVLQYDQAGSKAGKWINPLMVQSIVL